MKKLPMISIVILVHNAPSYTRKTLDTLSKTVYSGGYEVVVVDNNSEKKTRKLLEKYYERGVINKLILLDENKLFAKGNNIGVRACNEESGLILLLNSDIEIKDPLWLERMVGEYADGILSLGFVEGNPYSRADGYCFMIDRKLYEKYWLDEDFEWFWSITKLQAEVLRDGFVVKAVKNHENLLHHFGGASGGDWQGAEGMDVKMEKVIKWFGGKEVMEVDRID